MLNNSDSKKHWDERGSNVIVYKGEEYYTISPLPFYIKRRSLLLNYIKPYFNKDIKQVCDFGCGDGWYISHLSKTVGKRIKWTGIDISSSMIERARKLNGKCRFICSDNVITTGDCFHLIYSIAVLAHITDDTTLKIIFESINKHLHNTGKYIIFEQVAPYSYQGDKFKRRTIKEYKEIAESVGFNTEKVVLFSFRAHQIFERYVAKFWYNHLSKGTNDHDRRFNANRSLIFRWLSSLFLLLSRNPTNDGAESGWGNALKIFHKE